MTLLIIATMHDVAGLHVKGQTPQQFVDDVIGALPDWGRSHHSIVRLGDQTALIAEAAPNPFLRALESILEGDPEQLAHIFDAERDQIFGPSSPHVQFLWALETIAWDPRYLNRSALVLAKLGQLDPEPDSNHVNRPINSLRSILLGWSPNTYALQHQRIACLDIILKACPDVGWQLLKKLLPQHHDSTSRTQHPKLRDSAPARPEGITFGSVWDFEGAVVDRALVAASDDETRLGAFIEALGQLHSPNRKKVLAHIDGYLTAHQTDEGCMLWHAIKDEAARNEYFGSSDWALSHEELGAVKAVVERHRPADPLASDRYVFDTWTPGVGKRVKGSSEPHAPAELRTEVLQRVLDRDGVTGVLRLAQVVKLPDLLGETLSRVSIGLEQMFELMNGALTLTEPSNLRYYVSAAGYRKFGEQWMSAFRGRVLSQVANDDSKAKLLVDWPMEQTTWTYVEGLGDEVDGQYWRYVGLLPLQAPLSELMFAIEKFRSVGRDVEVLSLIDQRIGDLPSGLILELLGGGYAQIKGGVEYHGGMMSYYIERAFKELRTRNDVERLEISKLEYQYLPLLSHSSASLTILSVLADDPRMFVDVLSHVFRGKNESPDRVITDEISARANNSFRLLSTFKVVPGLRNGTIDAQVLARWVDEVRALAAMRGLDEIGDQRIGYVLAHAPEDASAPFWPPSAVCEVIDAVAAEHVERGFAIECFNKRGVYSKAMNEGGGQERALAARYKGWAEATLMYPRTSAMLTSIADDWNRHADYEDVRAEQDKMKF